MGPIEKTTIFSRYHIIIINYPQRKYQCCGRTGQDNYARNPIFIHGAVPHSCCTEGDTTCLNPPLDEGVFKIGCQGPVTKEMSQILQHAASALAAATITLLPVVVTLFTTWLVVAP